MVVCGRVRDTLHPHTRTTKHTQTQSPHITPSPLHTHTQTTITNTTPPPPDTSSDGANKNPVDLVNGMFGGVGKCAHTHTNKILTTTLLLNKVLGAGSVERDLSPFNTRKETRTSYLYKLKCKGRSTNNYDCYHNCCCYCQICINNTNTANSVELDVRLPHSHPLIACPTCWCVFCMVLETKPCNFFQKTKVRVDYGCKGGTPCKIFPQQWVDPDCLHVGETHVFFLKEYNTHDGA